MRFLPTLLCSLSLLLPLTTWAGEEEEACAPLPEAAPRISQALEEPVGTEGATALLVLPRAALDGLDDPSLILAEGVTIVDSYWSPVLCASISRVRGPAGLRAGSLVPGLPEGGTVTPDDTYFTSAAVAEDAMSGPDPYRPLQYALDELELDAARLVTAGAGARIAVLDSAPETGHPDLGRVEIVAQIVPAGPAHHGTMIAGILSAKPENRFGIAGVAPEADVLAIPVCVAGPPERGDACALYDVLRGLDAAWERRAHIVNLSLAGPTNPLLQGATDRLDRLGVTLVAAVGNDSSEEALYPAAYASVIGVGATGRNRAPYPEGNRGPGLELTAPGVDIVSTAPGGGFAFANGTSMATVHVSGVLALLASATGDLQRARQTLLLEAHRHPKASSQVGVLPSACALLKKLEHPCPASAP
ncbi:MAG: S8 family serine peptidase [Deltaproteobacteria bacterium]|nr:S8 family serine peptidase [Deltaproteobacteria bacterium]MBW2395487.1 S8 family serine peptidase [Deltaproteobacteria bacterium]